jgi:transposase
MLLVIDSTNCFESSWRTILFSAFFFMAVLLFGTPRILSGRVEPPLKFQQPSGRHHRSIKQVAKDLDLTETALRDWVKRADIDAGKGPPEALTTAEREEMARLRRELKRVTMEREILKAAATFFAKESE